MDIIIEHFNRSASPQAKVCISREICVRLYEKMRAIEGCPPVEIVMTGNIDKDPKEWREEQPGSEFAHIKTKEEQENVKSKLRNPDDPLKLVIVRDMWLTGTDIPPLTYLYVDKPIKGHGLIQAIARVNRVFPGKTGGVVVDYIGIADALKEATHKYTQGGGKGKPISDLAVNEMFSNPLSPKEVEQATRSAEKKWENQSGKTECSINRRDPDSYQTISYFYNNDKIIRQLNITPEEQRELLTIIGPEEKKRRELERKEQKRRAANKPTRLMITEKKEEKIRKVRQILADNPGMSIRQLSRMTGFSKSAIQRYLKLA